MNKKKLRYAILKEINSGNKRLTEKDFGVSEDDFDETVRYLDREGYLKGLMYADDRPCLFEGTAYVTEKGEDYLSANSKLSKTYKGLKEIRDWLKL
ncbi:YjcQ family protein [Novibacillus thermophilus]|uniref:YjcQ protein n=1 Tax=Novibacillus thermophilus TaxID=1471761 RepID=A0A1U9K5I4_9BACL|nr:YjcQ family protein [Novibacillus thermophilus]AQS55282.1 hypothetical protein B0W44_05290 [Novibacillus thermophilus]